MTTEYSNRLDKELNETERWYFAKKMFLRRGTRGGANGSEQSL